MKILETHINSFPDFISSVQFARTTIGTDNLWYRGISKASHKLIPGLFRYPPPTTIDEITKIERRIYEEFSFRSPSYDNVTRDKWDLLFLMQHYRAPTRLLDWTSSPFIALFFALSGAQGSSEDAVIWVMDPTLWNSGILHDISQEPTVFTTSNEILEPYHPATKATTRRSEPLAVEGIINNPRINAQRGKFVIFGHRLKSMEEFAEECTCDSWTTKAPILKIVCKNVGIKDLSNDLRHYGITHSSVFPDLEGLAVELKTKNGYAHV